MEIAKYMEISTDDNTLIGEKIGSVTIDVYKSPDFSSAFYYLKANCNRVMPIVEVLDDVLTCHAIHL